MSTLAQVSDPTPCTESHVPSNVTLPHPSITVVFTIDISHKTTFTVTTYALLSTHSLSFSLALSQTRTSDERSVQTTKVAIISFETQVEGSVLYHPYTASEP